MLMNQFLCNQCQHEQHYIRLLAASLIMFDPGRCSPLLASSVTCVDKSWNQENPAKLPEMLDCSHESQHHLKSCPSVKRLSNQEDFGDFDIWCWSSWASSFTYHLAYLCMLYMTQICTWYMSCRLHIRTSLFNYVYIHIYIIYMYYTYKCNYMAHIDRCTRTGIPSKPVWFLNR